MSHITIFLLFVSLSILLLGTYLWRITSNRSVFMNTMFGTISMLLAAYHTATHRQMEWAIMLPFFTTMLFGGRAMGVWWRSRKDAELRLPAEIMTAVAGLAAVATITAYTAL